MSIYRLTLAWISSENSTTHEEWWLILTRLPSLLWTSSHPTGLSAVRCRLLCPSSVVNSLLLVPFPTPFSRSLTHFRSCRDLESKTLCLVSRQNRQRNRLLDGPPTVTFRSLVKQTTTRNLYITIYIYFLDGRLCEVGAVWRGIRIVRRWGLNSSM